MMIIPAPQIPPKRRIISSVFPSSSSDTVGMEEFVTASACKEETSDRTTSFPTTFASSPLYPSPTSGGWDKANKDFSIGRIVFVLPVDHDRLTTVLKK